MSLLSTPKKEPSVTAKLVSKLSSTLFLAEAVGTGKKYRVESDGSYRLGQTVTIRNGVVVNKTKSARNIKQFMV